MKTLLVVDDEKLIRWALCEGLREKYMVFTAGSAQEAQDIVGRIHVDAVITDLKMPGGDGQELVETLKRGHPKLKIFVITAYAAEAVTKHLLDRGVLACLPKPFEMEAVHRMLEEHFGKEALLPRSA